MDVLDSGQYIENYNINIVWTVALTWVAPNAGIKFDMILKAVLSPLPPHNPTIALYVYLSSFDTSTQVSYILC
jgi:hypothetical protein